MKILIVGGAGYVGSIIVPTLEKEFECAHLDIKPVPGYENHTVLADVGDEEKVQEAIVGVDVILYLAMGVPKKSLDPQKRLICNVINPIFDVNVRGLYQFLYLSLKAGIKRFIYASSLSVYDNIRDDTLFDENRPAEAWTPYGLSKRTGEFICSCATQTHASACVTAIRLIMPSNENDWLKNRYDFQKPKNSCATGPNDTRRLFLAAVNFDKPGFHLMQASGDMEGKFFPNKRVNELFGWLPKNE